MASIGAIKRLTREYATLQQTPVEYIVAHPSESNILEWHYILTGPPNTPYAGGQYWGILTFPPDYPFNPPGIRMLTPSGRFQTNTRLCLSISDFHPKSFNPAWSVSTILVGLMSFMTSEEMTTGSIRASESERKLLAQMSRWNNCTGNGSARRNTASTRQNYSSNSFRAGDGGATFRSEWEQLNIENWKWIEAKGLDPDTGLPPKPQNQSCTPGARAALTSLNPGPGAVVEGAQVARNAGQGFLRRHIILIGFLCFLGYALASRLSNEASSEL